jgi:hypothetical protein
VNLTHSAHTVLTLPTYQTHNKVTLTTTLAKRNGVRGGPLDTDHITDTIKMPVHCCRQYSLDIVETTILAKLVSTSIERGKKQ